MLLKHPLRHPLRHPMTVALGILLAVGFAPQALFAASEPGFHAETYNPDSLLARRNQFLWSEDATNAYWTKGDVTVSQVAAAAPDTVATATQVLETATTAQHTVYTSTYSFSVGDVYTASWYVKPINGRTRVRISGTSSLGPIGVDGQYFDLTGSGSYDTPASGVTAAISAEGNGYYRISATFTAAAGGALVLGTYLISSGTTSSYLGDVSKGVFWFGAMLEKRTSAVTAYQKVTDWNTEYMAAALDRIGMWQDSIGNTPVTAVEQPVGRWLDSRLGSTWPRGADLIVNGDGSTLTGWTASAGVSIQAGQFKLTTSGAPDETLDQSFTTVVNRTYELVYEKVSAAGGAGDLYVRVGTAQGGSQNYDGFSLGSNPAGTYRVQFTASATTTWLRFMNITDAGATVLIDNVSTKEVGSGGNHATQATAASRPTLSARYNLLTKTEQFDDAAWVDAASNITKTANAVVAPNGTTTADTLAAIATGLANFYQVITTAAQSSTYTARIYVRAGTVSTLGLSMYDSTNGAHRTSAATILSGPGAVAVNSNVAELTGLTSEWTLVELVATGQPIGSALRFYGYLKAVVSATAGDSLHFWGADARHTSDWSLNQPAYQRVNTATDYDTAGFIHRLKFDGVDDSLATPAINFSAVDKVSVFAGITKSSDAAAGILAELTANANSNNGAFFLAASDVGGVPSASFSVQMRGTVVANAAGYEPTTYTSPLTRILTALFDLAGADRAAAVKPYINQVLDQGEPDTDLLNTGGNFANAALNIGRRDNLSIPFNGSITSLTVRGSAAATTAPVITRMERYAARVAGVTL